MKLIQFSSLVARCVGGNQVSRNCVSQFEYAFRKYLIYQPIVGACSHPRQWSWSNFLPEFISIFSRRQMEINYTLVFTNYCHPSWKTTATTKPTNAQWFIWNKDGYQEVSKKSEDPKSFFIPHEGYNNVSSLIIVKYHGKWQLWLKLAKLRDRPSKQSCYEE